MIIYIRFESCMLTSILHNQSVWFIKSLFSIVLVNNRSQSFTLTGNSNNAVQSMVGSTGNANFCQADYLIIPMATNVGRPVSGPSLNVDRICGGVFSADITLQPSTVRSELFFSEYEISSIMYRKTKSTDRNSLLYNICIIILNIL